MAEWCRLLMTTATTTTTWRDATRRNKVYEGMLNGLEEVDVTGGVLFPQVHSIHEAILRSDWYVKCSHSKVINQYSCVYAGSLKPPEGFVQRGM